MAAWSVAASALSAPAPSTSRVTVTASAAIGELTRLVGATAAAAATGATTGVVFLIAAASFWAMVMMNSEIGPPLAQRPVQDGSRQDSRPAQGFTAPL